MGYGMEDLQKEATVEGVSVTNLLRKALIVADSMGMTEFGEWVKSELTGYMEGSEVPDYRGVAGCMHAWDSSYGLRPVRLGIDEKSWEIQEYYSEIKIGHSVVNLEYMMGKGDSKVFLQFGREINENISKIMGVEMEYGLVIEKSTISRVINSIITNIIRWTLLGGGKIGGEVVEKGTERKNNFNFILGCVKNSQIQQGVTRSGQDGSLLNKIKGGRK